MPAPLSAEEAPISLPDEEPQELLDKREASAPEGGTEDNFYIVGMGGSAGSLEAFSQFLKNMPSNTGMSFVVVSHQDPSHKGMLPEILQRYSSMKILPVKDGMKVQPNNVYVIPSNKDMSILHGNLQLLDPMTTAGIRMPIDFFFRHLAEDKKANSIGIIFSGMGTDGTLGLRAIKEKMGLGMAQDMDTTAYDSMPRSAIEAGLVDIVAPADQLPTKLVSYVKHFTTIEQEMPKQEKKAETGLEKIIALLRSQTGNDFSLYKKNTILRRIERRLSVHQIQNINLYVRYLQENPHEIDLLFKELLIGVTSFFRDPEAFDILKMKAIPDLIENARKRQVLRVWVPGCSTGEEAYSLAIIIREYLDQQKWKTRLTIQIYATDLDKDAINVARAGIYPSNIAADVLPERLARFFIMGEDERYQVKKEIREMLVFAVQNLISDPPFTKIDLLSCRNLLIYLSPELQKIEI